MTASFKHEAGTENIFKMYNEKKKYYSHALKKHSLNINGKNLLVAILCKKQSLNTPLTSHMLFLIVHEGRKPFT